MNDLIPVPVFQIPPVDVENMKVPNTYRHSPRNLRNFCRFFGESASIPVCPARRMFYAEFCNKVPGVNMTAAEVGIANFFSWSANH
jgi:hypothetical protein